MTKQKTAIIDLAAKIIGCLICEAPADIETAKQYLSPSDFMTNDLCAFADLLWTMHSEDIPINIEHIVLNHEQRKYNINMFGHLYSICMQRVTSTANFEYECRMLSQYATAKKLGLIYNNANLQLQSGTDPFAVSEELQTNTQVLFDTFTAIQTTHIADIGAMEMIEHILKTDGLLGTTTGYQCIDKETGGYVDSDLIIIGGRPGMGKTALMLCNALYAAKAGKSVVFFSLEMASVQLKMRLLSIMSGVGGARIRNKSLDGHDMLKLKKANKELSELKIYIEDNCYTIQQIRAKAKQLHKFDKVDIIFMDYLQLGRSDRKKAARYEEVGDVSRGLKQLAKELLVPVIAGSQIGRDSAGRRPTMTDLRESGNIEQDADLIKFVHRPEYYHAKKEEVPEEERGLAEIIIGKNRHGAMDTFELKFLGPITKFIEEGYEMTDEKPYDDNDDINEIDTKEDEKVPF